jgi:anti-sigma-K factor RskA
MNDTHEQMLDDVAVYALGALPPAQAQQVRDHLQTCEACRNEYAALAPAVAAIAASAPAPEPSALLKGRVMRAVRATLPAPAPAAAPAPASSPARTNLSAWGPYLVAAACFALAVSLGLINLSLINQLKASKEYALQLEHQSKVVAHEALDDERVLADLTNASAKRYNVANGQIVRIGDRIYLAMHDMPALPHGRVYQAWTLPKGAKEMVPSPTFVPDSHGAALLALPVRAAATAAVAISIEPEGGSKEPTTKPLVVQALD